MSLPWPPSFSLSLPLSFFFHDRSMHLANFFLCKVTQSQQFCYSNTKQTNTDIYWLYAKENTVSKKLLSLKIFLKLSENQSQGNSNRITFHSGNISIQKRAAGTSNKFVIKYRLPLCINPTALCQFSSYPGEEFHMWNNFFFSVLTFFIMKITEVNLKSWQIIDKEIKEITHSPTT